MQSNEAATGAIFNASRSGVQSASQKQVHNVLIERLAEHLAPTYAQMD
jgi:hypothetical protein